MRGALVSAHDQLGGEKSPRKARERERQDRITPSRQVGRNKQNRPWSIGSAARCTDAGLWVTRGGSYKSQWNLKR
jgi:hypothetical protein